MTRTQVWRNGEIAIEIAQPDPRAPITVIAVELSKLGWGQLVAVAEYAQGAALKLGDEDVSLMAADLAEGMRSALGMQEAPKPARLMRSARSRIARAKQRSTTA